MNPNLSRFQTHFTLETPPPFRLISYWTRLVLDGIQILSTLIHAPARGATQNPKEAVAKYERSIIAVVLE
jgi:hypothetical protein